MTPLIFELPIPGVIVVELSERADLDVLPSIMHINGRSQVVYSQSNGFIITRTRLPPGNWRLIGRLSEVTEMDAIPLVDKERFIVDGPDLGFRNYKGNKYDWFGTALESLHSAIKAAGLFIGENPYPNINDPKFYDEPYDGTGFYQEIYSSALKDWGDKEQRTICPDRTVILKRI